MIEGASHVSQQEVQVNWERGNSMGQFQIVAVVTEGIDSTPEERYLCNLTQPEVPPQVGSGCINSAPPAYCTSTALDPRSTVNGQCDHDRWQCRRGGAVRAVWLTTERCGCGSEAVWLRRRSWHHPNTWGQHCTGHVEARRRGCSTTRNDKQTKGVCRTVEFH